jgi:dienelactone hydrolase
VRERTSVDGIPVSSVRPAGDGPFPGVVVVHGFSGSSRLMDGIGIAFARAGWLAAMPDLSGHGANPESPGVEADAGEDEVHGVLDWLDERDDVDNGRTCSGTRWVPGQ